MDRLASVIENFGSPRVVLIGDFILDRWVYGSVERLSQEAPVPVLKVAERKTLTGGAGNVAEAVTALGAKVSCVGIVGNDKNGDELIRLLTGSGADTSRIVRLGERPTAVKTRYVGLAQHRHPQQMLRVDEEVTDPVDDRIQSTIRAAARCELHDCKVLAIEDYNKGILTNAYTPELIADARKAGCMVVVDPALIEDYRRYRGATLLTPNRYEASFASGIEIVDDDSLQRAAAQILLTTQADAVIITLDKEGMYLCRKNEQGKRIAAKARNVYDITGAGDQVLAMLAIALSEGCEMEQAVQLANIAGGIQVGRQGMVPVKRCEMLDEIRHMVGLRSSKVMDRPQLAEEVAKRKAAGETVVFTNGCFDMLHVGHVRILQQARERGSCLVVGINSDESIRRLKGPTRPIIPQTERAEMLAALEWVDMVTIFEEDTSRELIELLKPSMFFKGGTTDVVVERDIVESYGGVVETLDLVEGFSTTNIINRIVETHDRD